MEEKLNWCEIFEYDENSPSCLRWATDIYYLGFKDSLILKRKIGDVAGTKQSHEDYCRWKVKYQQKAYMVHRIVYELHYGPIPEGLVVDHRDGDPCNNKIENLRVVENKINARNVRKKATNTTEYTGVTKRTTGNYVYYAAAWNDLSGKMHNKYFSISKLGDELAEFLAQEYRQHQIDLLNLVGAGYTDRHGT